MNGNIPVFSKNEYLQEKSVDSFYLTKSTIFDYISHYYKEYGVSKSAVDNMLKYGFLREHIETIGKKGLCS